MNNAKNIKIANNLSYKELVCMHLARYLSSTDVMRMPYATTQDGISEALEISRAHVSITLSNSPYLFNCTLAHVVGKKSKLKTYSLTVKGMELAEDTAKMLISNGYKPEDALNRPGKPEYPSMYVCKASENAQKALHHIELGEYDQAEYALATAITFLVQKRTE